METTRSIRQQLERKKGRRDQLEKNILQTKKDIRAEKRIFKHYEQALEIVKQVGLETQKQLEYHLAEQVSLALAAVFDDPYELVVDFHEKRGKTEAELSFKRRNLMVRPRGNVGGGAINVASFALRLAYWTMRQDKQTRPTLLLDEPFAGLKGEEANRKALSLVNEISKRLGIQIIMISDERMPREDIISGADKAFLVSQRKGKSKVEVL